MRKIFVLITVVCLFLSAINAFAGRDSEINNDDTLEDGLHGGLVIGVIGLSRTPSQLDVTDDNKIATTLFEKAKSSSRMDPVILPELGYTFASTRTDISLGSIEDGTFNLTLTQFIENVGIFAVAGSYAKNKVWKDPYLLDVKREETDAIMPGVELSWGNIFDTGVVVSFSYQSVDVKNDTLAERFDSLNRDGEIYSANLGVPIPIGKHNLIQPFSSISIFNMEGKSNSSIAYSGGIEHTFQWQNISFQTTANITRTEFDRKHPVYDKIRSETATSVSETISYDGLFGFENISAYLLITYQLTNSNIDFFDSSSFTSGIGVGYRF